MAEPRLLIVEDAPFQFDIQGKRQIRSAPWGYMKDVVKNIFVMLNNLKWLVAIIYTIFPK